MPLCGAEHGTGKNGAGCGAIWLEQLPGHRRLNGCYGLGAEPVWQKPGGCQVQKYAEFVTQGMRTPAPRNELKGQVLLGSEQIVSSLQPLLEG